MPTKDTKDIVHFLMPDGTKVSNDPNFDLEEALTEQLNSTPYTGDAGVPRDEQEATMQSVREAALQGNDVDDPDSLLPTVGSGLQVQRDDVKAAQESGATPPTAEPIDTNEAVQKAREAREEAREQVAKSAAKLGEEGAGDPEQPYNKWTGKQVMHEIRRRNAERENEADRIDMTGVSKKAQAVQKLEEDDAAQGNAPGDSSSAGPTA